MQDERSRAGGGWNQRARERDSERESERGSERVRCWRLVRLGEPLLWYRFTGGVCLYADYMRMRMRVRVRVRVRVRMPIGEARRAVAMVPLYW
jgi:hypothetical protein